MCVGEAILVIFSKLQTQTNINSYKLNNSGQNVISKTNYELTR